MERQEYETRDCFGIKSTIVIKDNECVQTGWYMIAFDEFTKRYCMHYKINLLDNMDIIKKSWINMGEKLRLEFIELYKNQ